MTTIINCPGCNRGLQLPDNLVGQEVQCPTCSRTFTAVPHGVSSSPIKYTQDDVESRPSGRRPPPPTFEDDIPDDMPARRRSRSKPGKVMAIAIMMLAGGILAL